MQSFKAFVQESKGPISKEEAIAHIKKYGSEYLTKNKKELLNAGNMHGLFRGIRNAEDFIIGSPRQHRQPKNTPVKIQQTLDSYFEKHFKKSLRSSGLFASTNEQQAENYGTVYCVFPDNGYSLVFSEYVEDLFNILQDPYEYSEMFEDHKAISRNISQIEMTGLSSGRAQIDAFFKMMDDFQYDETRLLSKIPTGMEGVEVMINCTGYVAVNQKFVKDILFEVF